MSILYYHAFALLQYMQMTRLPTPGGDAGTWGNVLNDFLNTAHNSDGTLKPITDSSVSAISQSKITGLSAALAAKDSYRGAWAAATSYAVNDIVTHGEGVYIITAAHTSSSSFDLTNKTRLNGRKGVFDVMDYGAVGDDTTDDTAAINAAVAAGVAAGQSDGTYYAEIYFPPAIYKLSSATIKGGAAKANAQIPLPYFASAGGGKKFTLVLRSVPDGTAFAHWQQTTGQLGGSAVLHSSLTGQTSDATWGSPSVIGGPSNGSGGVGNGTFSNMLIVVEGIKIICEPNPSLVAFDFNLVAQANIISASAMANAGPAGTPALSTTPTDGGGVGLIMPQNNNNDESIALNFGCEGFYYGISVGEHFTGVRVALIYCAVAIFVRGIGGASYHGLSILNLSVEGSTIGIQCTDTSGGALPISIAAMHTESIGTWDIDDQYGNFNGYVYWSGTHNGTPPNVRAANLKVISMMVASAPGAKTAPAVPASATPYTHTFFRDCAVTISGGTVSAIAVDGTSLGITSGTVIVPSNKSITLTYTVAPTWQWVAL